MIDRHIEPMGNMGFFNEEIIYGAVEHMAPAEFLPHPSGYYEQVNERLRMSTGYRRNYRTMAAPISVPMGDPIEPGASHTYRFGRCHFRLTITSPDANLPDDPPSGFGRL
ncbi:hypothetical protein E2562_035691 [Oryza meyeriana var. granulata]|uniref:Uncharacterized protein n=1 Tax=Oryza meyeriana var. granulata TaxID=110450 RepID=A0A6G1CWX6_9ORYZ|nr:hypothetical protein E2562_035691 [Oryza meyeriana var. granulata]